MKKTRILSGIFPITMMLLLLASSSLQAQLSGIFTINPEGEGDYFTLQESIDDLASEGMDGSVVLQLTTGTHIVDEVVVGYVDGMSSDNTLTIRSQSGNAEDVTLEGDGAFVIRIHGTAIDPVEHVTLEHLTIRNSGGFTVVEVQGTISGIRIADNRLFGLPTTLNQVARSLVRAFDLVGAGLFIERNLMEENSRGIHAQSASSGNPFRDLHIDGNRIGNVRSGNILYNMESAQVINNRIQVNWNDALLLNFPLGNETLIANNVLISNRSTVVRTTGSPVQPVRFYHNTIVGLGGGLTDEVLRVTQTAHHIRNNIIFSAGPGRTHFDHNNASHWSHNNLYTAGPYLGQFGSSNIPDNIGFTLADLVDKTGKHQNSFGLFPALDQENDYRSNSPLLDQAGDDLTAIVPADIDGNPRSSTPSIGAFEYGSTVTPFTSGTYTVGSGGDFASPGAMIDAIHERGITGDVTFEILPGTYAVGRGLHVVPPATGEERVTIRSQSGNPDDVTLVGVTGVEHVIDLNGARFVTIEDITFDARELTTNSRHALGMNGGVSDITLHGNRFIGEQGASNQNRNLISGTEVRQSNYLFEDNEFEGGYYALRLNTHMGGSLNAGNLTFRKNRVESFGAVRIQSFDGALIEKNVIHADRAVSLSHMNRTPQAEEAGTRALISNNQIASRTEGGNTVYGIWIFSSDAVELLHNTVRILKNPGSQGAIDINSSADVDFANNIIVVETPTATNPIYRIAGNTSDLRSDHNHFFGLMTNKFRDGSTNFTTLEDFQLGTEYDSESSFGEVAFESDDELRPADDSASDSDMVGTNQFLQIVNDDILDNLRGNPPFKGAYEPEDADINSPPFFTSTTDGDVIKEGDTFDFQFEAEDPNDDDLTFSITDGSDIANSSITEDGFFTFTPADGQVGEFQFTIEVSDGELTDEYSFAITVEWQVLQRYYVSESDGDDQNRGANWGSPLRSLKEALSRAVENETDEIWIASGMYVPTSDDTDRSASFDLFSGLSLYGGFSGHESSVEQRDPEINETILSGQINDSGNLEGNSYSVLMAENVLDLLIDGFTISGGNANGNEGDASYSGGGLFVGSGSMTVRNSLITENFSGFFGGGVYIGEGAVVEFDNVVFCNNEGNEGGAILVYGGEVNLIDSRFENNFSYGGGAMKMFTGSVASIRNTLFTENESFTSGGAIWIINSEMDISETEFSENSSFEGTIYSQNSSLSLYRVHFKENSSQFGGAVNSVNSNIFSENLTFKENQSENGGALYSTGNSHEVYVNSLFYGNSATEKGGAVMVLSTETQENEVWFVNSLFYDNSAETGGAVYSQDDTNLFVYNSIFSENEASETGHDLFNSHGELTLSHNLFKDGFGSPQVRGNYTDLGGNISGDPLFVNAENNNFRPLPGSPVNQSGTNEPFEDGGIAEQVTRDFVGNSRIRGDNADIGPFESEPEEEFEPFITTWQSDNEGSSVNNQITIPTHPEETYNYNVYWEDVNDASVNGTETGVTGNITLEFPEPGTYLVKVSGEFPHFFLNNEGDRRKLLSIEQWGDISWTSMEGAFRGAENLTYHAEDVPDLSNVTLLRSMFSGASQFNGDIGNWDISSVEGSYTMQDMLSNSGMSIANYDATLTGWAAFVEANDGPQNLTLGAEGLEYCNSADARQTLIEDFGWTITGDSQTDSCALPRIYVSSTSGNDENSGSSWEGAFATLYAALNAINPEVTEEIWVASGTYYPTDNGDDRSATFQLISGVALYGGFNGTETVPEDRDWETNTTTLSGDINQSGSLEGNSYSVVTGSGTDSTAILDGFVVTGGNGNISGNPGSGGGMKNNGGHPKVRNTVFTDNYAVHGGGMWNFASMPILESVQFIGNASVRGGGMHNRNGSEPVLFDVTFEDNSASFRGGAMENAYGSNTRLTDVYFSGNKSERGGGISNVFNSSPTLINVVFSNNSADSLGGGIFNSGNSNPSLVNTVFHGNTAINGAGISANQSSPVLTNVTFYDNTADGYGGGLYHIGAAGSPMLANVIMWGNTASSGRDIYGAAESIASISHCLINMSEVEGDVNDKGGNIDGDPLFVDAGAGDFRLGVESPVIRSGTNEPYEAGGPANGVLTDLAGNSRIVGGTVDLGAYEFQRSSRSSSRLVSRDSPEVNFEEERLSLSFIGIPQDILLPVFVDYEESQPEKARVSETDSLLTLAVTWSITTLGDHFEEANISFNNISEVEGVAEFDNLTLYSRPLPGEGFFTPVENSFYLPETDQIQAVVTGFSEFVLGIGTTSVSVDDMDTDIPQRYILDQNYPNPFNPTTNIQFRLPEHSDVRLDVYDILGRLVATLLREELEPGIHSVEFDAGTLASGIYIYRLQAGTTVMLSRKMILLK